jgi:RHS repeat-associated protein
LKFEETTYDSLSRVETQTDCKGQLTVYTYNVLGRLEFERHYANAAAYISATPTFNANPEIHTTYDTLGRKETATMCSYNSAGQLVSGSEKQWGYAYDNEGRVNLVVSPQGNIWYEYSPVTGRMTSMRILQSDLVTIVSRTDYAYDELGRLKTVTVKKRNEVTVDEATTYTYNAVGSLESIYYPNNVKGTYGYNALNRLTDLLWEKGSGTPLTWSPVYRYHYGLYADGQRANSQEFNAGSAAATAGFIWQYDALNRLTQEQYGNGGIDDYVRQYVYDLSGNRKSVKDGSGNTLTAYTYNAMDQLTFEDSTSGQDYTYIYDDNGSQIQRIYGSNLTDPKDVYSYDLRGRLTGLTPKTGSAVTYAYDPAGNRVGMTAGTVITSYLIDSMNPTGYAQVLQSTTGTNKTFYMLGSDVIGQVVNTVGLTRLYMLYDGHGSVCQRTNYLGSTTLGSAYDYDAYGNKIGNPSLSGSGLYYTGEMYDSYLGMYYDRDRYYNPQNGRFNAVDSWTGNTQDPQSLHKYLYVHNNPINAIDPSGKMALLMDFLTAFNLGEQLKAVKDNPNLVIRKGIEEVKDEIKDAFDWSDPMPIPVVAQNAEILWVARLRMLGLNAIPMQSSAVGQHGPDILAFGYVGGKYTVLVGEVKGMKRSRVLSSLDRLSNGIMQMSARWIDKYASLMANTISEAVVDAGAGLLPPGTGEIIQNILKDQSQFELYLLRARYYSGEEWRLKGFRLMRIGKENVGIGASLDRNLEQEIILKTPAGLIP